MVVVMSAVNLAALAFLCYIGILLRVACTTVNGLPTNSSMEGNYNCCTHSSETAFIQ